MLRQQHHHSDGPGTTVLHAMGQIDTRIEPPPPSNENVPTGDLLDSPMHAGYGAPQHQQQQPPGTLEYEQQPDGTSTTVINAAQATVAITAPNAAPSIPGLGKIEPNSASGAINMINNAPKRKVIVVPTYSCNGGLDTKFNPSPKQARPSHLHNLLTPDEYTDAITTLNDKVKKSRASSLDVALLATGPLLVPLAAWGARHAKQAKQRRILIELGVSEFNELMVQSGRKVRMIWNKHGVGSGGESYLTIEEVFDQEMETRENYSPPLLDIHGENV